MAARRIRLVAVLALGSLGTAGAKPPQRAYLRANSGFTGMQLVPGTEPFKPNLVGAILGS